MEGLEDESRRNQKMHLSTSPYLLTNKVKRNTDMWAQGVTHLATCVCNNLTRCVKLHKTSGMCVEN